MHALSKTALLALLCFAGISAPVSAQSLPPGTYLETCTNPRVDGGWGSRYDGTLRADCPDTRYRYRSTSINADCHGDIANENGQLRCRAYGYQGGGSLPPGSYRMTCYGARMNGGTLSATCMDAYNNRRGSSIAAGNCRGGDIANLNGRLSCARGGNGQGGNNGYVPGGSYQQTCDSAYVSGGTLHARCADQNGYSKRSAINTNSCQGRDIANDGGRLVCANTGWQGNNGWQNGNNNGSPMPGSYNQSCNSAYMRGNTLYATCADNNGRYKRTELNISSCRGRDIANYGGKLSCNT